MQHPPPQQSTIDIAVKLAEEMELLRDALTKFSIATKDFLSEFEAHRGSESDSQATSVISKAKLPFRNPT